MKVISGAQVGADIAGLRAAKACGIETGGCTPKLGRIKGGFRTQEEMELYGLYATWSYNYPYRTKMNVISSDATIRLATTFNSRGEQLTLKELKENNKPYLDIPIVRVRGEWQCDVFYQSAASWLRDNGYETVNIAGNANPDIEGVVERYLTLVFRRWQFLMQFPTGYPGEHRK